MLLKEHNQYEIGMTIDKAHIITFKEKQIQWLTFSNLIKADDPSHFPALSQMEVHGK